MNQKTVPSQRSNERYFEDMAPTDIHLQIPSDAFYIEPVRVFVGNLAKSLGFSRKRVADIELVLDEICSNAVHHGSVNRTVGITLCIQIHTHALTFLIRDTGGRSEDRCEGERHTWLTEERLSEIERSRSPRNERGHGIFIIKSLADTHDMEPNAVGGTDVRAGFYFKKSRDSER